MTTEKSPKVRIDDWIYKQLLSRQNRGQPSITSMVNAACGEYLIGQPRKLDLPELTPDPGQPLVRRKK